MTCRRCGEGIADGSERCPVCGISQNTYITPRNYNAIKSAPAKRMPKSAFLSIVAILVAIAGVIGSYFIAERHSENRDLQIIREAYEDRDETKMFLVVGQFMRKYPRSSHIDEVESLYLKLVNGDTEAIGSTPEEMLENYEREQERILETLKQTARDQIMSVEGIRLPETSVGGERGMIIAWRNMSGKDIKEVLFVVEAIDADGVPAAVSVNGTSKLALTEDKFTEPNGAADTPYESFWLGVWTDGEIDRIELNGVRITYGGGEVVSLPKEVCALITG
ncbi:MAG: hypothetical protein FWH06_04185 [Oscillospiraceae bacterium]|nr:hypothetical protein [Oscillospiraceae bacterium]